MVKQGNIFEPTRIDILTDTARELSRDQLQRLKEQIEANNNGITVSIPKGSSMKAEPLKPETTPQNQITLF